MNPPALDAGEKPAAGSRVGVPVADASPPDLLV